MQFDPTNSMLPGQGPTLHDSVSVAAPVHRAPPFDAGVASVLERVLVPSPQDSLQADQVPNSLHLQSTVK